MKKFEYVMPTSMKEAQSLLKDYGERARFIAGGTDLIVRLKQRLLDIDCLVSLRHIPGLNGVGLREETNGVLIGAMTTFRELLGSHILGQYIPALIDAAKVLANPQVRNVATIGGNICNAAPSADSVPPLMVLDTKLIFQSREVELANFFEGPGKTVKEQDEILEAIEVKVPGPDVKTAFLKVGRVSQDIAIVNGSVSIRVEDGFIRDIRIALGAVAPTPLRLIGVERRLIGERPTEALLREAQEMAEREVRPISDVRASLEYRKYLSGILVKRLVLKALGKKEE